MVHKETTNSLPEIKRATTSLRSVDHLVPHATNGECDSQVAAPKKTKEVSRQRRYQLRRAEQGLCTICGIQPHVNGTHCEEHRKKNRVRSREYMRKRLGCERRNHNAKSYQPERDVARVCSNGETASLSRKENRNKGYLRSDRFTQVHRYSYNTVNKYRLTGLLGEDLFLAATPKNGGRIRVHEDAAIILREAGIHPRKRKPTSSRPSCKPPVERPEPADNAETKAVFIDLFAHILDVHGIDFIIDRLIDAEKERRKSAT